MKCRFHKIRKDKFIMTEKRLNQIIVEYDNQIKKLNKKEFKFILLKFLQTIKLKWLLIVRTNDNFNE
jgi:hypothetical protein